MNSRVTNTTPYTSLQQSRDSSATSGNPPTPMDLEGPEGVEEVTNLKSNDNDGA